MPVLFLSWNGKKCSKQLNFSLFSKIVPSGVANIHTTTIQYFQVLCCRLIVGQERKHVKKETKTQLCLYLFGPFYYNKIKLLLTNEIV